MTRVGSLAEPSGHKATAETVAAVALSLCVAFSLRIALANVLLGVAILAWISALAWRATAYRRTAMDLALAWYVAASAIAVVFSLDPAVSPAAATPALLSTVLLSSIAITSIIISSATIPYSHARFKKVAAKADRVQRSPPRHPERSRGVC